MRAAAKKPRRARRASHTFEESEIAALDEVLRCMLRGGDVRRMRKAAPLIGLHQKTQAMKASLARQKDRR